MGRWVPYSIFAIFQSNFEQSPIAVTSLLWNEQAACVLLILLSLDHLQNFRGVTELLSQELWELLALQTPRGFKSYSGDFGPASECDVLDELRKITALVFSFSSLLFKLLNCTWFTASVGQVALLQQVLC